MPRDKSLFYYGKPYHMVIDRITAQTWEKVVELVPADASVLDVGCGTGELGFLLKSKRNCTVVGVDLSLRMVAYANARNPYPDVTFLHRDAGDLGEFGDGHFDAAVLCLVMHELPRDKRLSVISELLRVAKETVIVDSNVPLPGNITGAGIRLIEVTIGRDHYDNFRSYIADGGIAHILEQAGLSGNVAHREVFKQNRQQVVVIRA
jgi:SAM-dependent methyltransferase